MFPYNVSAYIIIIETLKFVNALSKIFSFFFTNRQKNLRLFLSSGFSFGCGRLPLPQDILFLNQWSERKTVQVTGSTGKLLPDANQDRSFP